MNEDEFFATCIFCPDGPRRKMRGLFTPAQLKRKHPKCMACVSHYNARVIQFPGAQPGYAWRHKAL